MFRKALSRDLRTTVIAVIAASVVAGPSAAAAAYVANADKVDNKHAVSSGATTAARKGKLVATNPTTGLLPNNIIAKALNSDRLDGLDSTAFLPAGGKATDADKLDGRDADELVPRQTFVEVGDPDNEPLAALGNTVRDVAQITIAVPGPGRIQVDASTVLLAALRSNWYAGAELSISSSDAAHNPSPAGRAIWAVPASDPEADPADRELHYETLPVTRTFDVTGAGTYTYYLMANGGAETSTDDETEGVFHYTSQVTAQYFPAAQ